MNMKRSLALLLVLALVSVVLVGCDPCALLYGTWTSEDENSEYSFAKDGEGKTVFMQFPVPFTYTYKDGYLTVFYTEDIKEEGQVTFYGDHEFVWERLEDDGTTSETYFTRKIEE